MNLLTFSVILDDLTLSKMLCSARVLHEVNGLIADSNNHISAKMTGREIAELYKRLPYTDQHQLSVHILFGDADIPLITTEIEILKSSVDQVEKTSGVMRDVAMITIATLLLISSSFILFGYYENSRQHNRVIDSKLIKYLTELLETP